MFHCVSSCVLIKTKTPMPAKQQLLMKRTILRLPKNKQRKKNINEKENWTTTTMTTTMTITRKTQSHYPYMYVYICNVIYILICCHIKCLVIMCRVVCMSFSGLALCRSLSLCVRVRMCLFITLCDNIYNIYIHIHVCVFLCATALFESDLVLAWMHEQCFISIQLSIPIHITLSMLSGFARRRSSIRCVSFSNIRMCVLVLWCREDCWDCWAWDLSYYHHYNIF